MFQTHIRRSDDGDGLYRCRTCKQLKDKGKGGTHIATTTVTGGRIMRDPDLGHDALCTGIEQESAIAQQMRREMVNDVRAGGKHMGVCKKKSASLGN